jgi:hypothetical protein
MIQNKIITLGTKVKMLRDEYIIFKKDEIGNIIQIEGEYLRYLVKFEKYNYYVNREAFEVI